MPMGLFRPGEETDASPLDFFEWGSPIERPEEPPCLPMDLFVPGKESAPTPLCIFEIDSLDNEER